MVGGAPTPITAVGNRVVDLTPGALKDWAIETLGENDKPALLAGIFTVLALFAAATGVIAWRSRRTALALTAILGLVGLVAALADPTQLVGTTEKLAPAVAALVVSVGMLAWFTQSARVGAERAARGPGPHREHGDAVRAESPLGPEREPVLVTQTAGESSAGGPDSHDVTEDAGTSDGGHDVPPLEENPKPPGFDRRTFLAAALASTAVAATGFSANKLFGQAGAKSRASIRLPRPTDAAGPLPAEADLGIPGLTPYLTSNADFYRVDTALQVPQIDAANWSLRIHGMVDRDLELSFEDLVNMPLVERRITLTCVSNQVGGEYVGNATWLGVRIQDLLRQIGVSADADAVLSTAVDGFTIGTPLAALTDGRDAMIAIGMNGEPLPLTHGFPARMVVPGLYGYVSATKWLVDMEITRFEDFTAYWTDRGWDAEAPIKTASRIDVPRGFAQVKAGTVAVAGVAWAQHTGIATVEVRVDDGPWQEARLSDEATIDSWRQWVYEWDATETGPHKLEVRATDKSGYTQTPERVPPRPNGATGWHNITVTVT
jgi:DMSO/TMAO reductase YedYZ molybdopterin-dependent catalytic subunit